MTGRAEVMHAVPGLRDLAERQHHVCTRGQLTGLGIRPHHVDNQLRARRWQRLAPAVIVLHNGPMTPRASLWATTLMGPSDCALGSWTALALWGLQGWARPDTHLVIARGQRWVELPGVVIHESRRHSAADVAVRHGLPVHSAARAAVDAAAWSRSARTASGVIAAVVQQRLTDTATLAEELVAAGRVHRRGLLLLTLHDVAGGAHSLAEIDFAHLCRAAGLPEPVRQARRRDARGLWRFLDVEWRLADGRRLILEVDGVGHMEAGRWYDDLLRTAELALTDDQLMIRLPASAVRTEPGRVLTILRRHLAPRSLPAVRR